MPHLSGRIAAVLASAAPEEAGAALWECRAQIDPNVAKPCCTWPGYREVPPR